MKIIDSDAFIDMPNSTQCLYFHLGMRADDDGFVASPKRIAKMINAADDDLKLLIAKRFIMPFESGVCVIKHWHINNNRIKTDRYQATVYTDEKKTLDVKENKAYTEKTVAIKGSKQMSPKCLQNVSSSDAQSRVEESRGEEKNPASDDAVETNESKKKNQQIVDVIDAFVVVNSSNTRWYANKTQRSSVEHLIKTHTFEQVMKVITLLPKSNLLPYFPQITTPTQLADKWDALSNAFIRKKNEHADKTSNVIL